MSVFGMFKSGHNLCPYLDIRCPRHATRASINGEFGPRSDFIFYASAFYVHSTATLISVPWLPGLEYDYKPVVVAFLPTLRHYLQERGIPDISLEIGRAHV